MKKLLVLLFAVALTVVLVACGGGAETTPAASTTANPVVTTAPGSEGNTTVTTTVGGDTVVTTVPTTTETPVTTEPLYPGIDICFGDYDNMAIDGTWGGGWPCAFEDHHASLNFNVALVCRFIESVNGIYEQLVLTTDPDSTDNTTNWAMNESYKWVVIINDEEIEITNFSCMNDKTSGYVRMDLGDWTYSDEVDADGYASYDITLKIYDAATNEIAFWAWFTDPSWCDLYLFKEPEPIVMVDDPNRDPSHVVIPADKMEPLSGPEGMASETYDLLFDSDVRSKLCTNNTTDPTIMKFTSEQHIVSYSLVNGNDDESYTSRTPLQWTIYGSVDGNQWEVIDTQNLTETDHGNYHERNFKLETAVDYTYIKFEPVVSAMYQLCDILFYTTEDYANQ